jgi:hypothetical protein
VFPFRELRVGKQPLQVALEDISARNVSLVTGATPNPAGSPQGIGDAEARRTGSDWSSDLRGQIIAQVGGERRA